MTEQEGNIIAEHIDALHKTIRLYKGIFYSLTGCIAALVFILIMEIK